MYKIKQIPEDFIVKEIINLKLSEKGDYSYFILKKTEYTTLRALQKIARSLNIQLKNIGFAGTKDKKAITEQMISIRSNRKLSKNLEVTDLELTFVGFGNKPLSLGDNEGNAFEITIRNLDSDDINEIKYFLSFFGEQRFSKNNADVGRAIVKKDFKKAVELILENEREYKEQMEAEFSKSKNNYIGALMVLPKKILMIYIHAYQSLLWNKTAQSLSESFDPEKDNPNLPIVGFGTDIDEIEDNTIKNAVEIVMKTEKLSERDFIIRELQGFSPEGDLRKLFTEIKELKVIEKSDDDLNPGKKKIKISFKLGKGCYATEAIKAIIKN